MGCVSASDHVFYDGGWWGCCFTQTEKQRVIWAYKILFLDVLFPLNLRKVIFVDSDQVIRADFAQLWHMDLKVGGWVGAPHAPHSVRMHVHLHLSLPASSCEPAGPSGASKWLAVPQWLAMRMWWLQARTQFPYSVVAHCRHHT